MLKTAHEQVGDPLVGRHPQEGTASHATGAASAAGCAHATPFLILLTKIPDLAGAVITADQMHTQRKHARQIEAAGAFFVFTIGENQPRLFEAAGALPWESVAGDAWTVDRGHGRIDVRTIKTLPPTLRIRELFPHVEQVFLVERYSYGTDGELLGAVAVLGITSLPADQAGPADLLAYLRGHWSIEMHHYVRDVCLGEDASRIGRAHRARPPPAGARRIDATSRVLEQNGEQWADELNAARPPNRPPGVGGSDASARRASVRPGATHESKALLTDASFPATSSRLAAKMPSSPAVTWRRISSGVLSGAVAMRAVIDAGA